MFVPLIFNIYLLQVLFHMKSCFFLVGMLTLRDLVNAIAEKFEGRILEGSELYGMKNNHPSPCRIIKILEDDNKTKFEVVWLGEDLKAENELVNGEVFITKMPFTREVLKSFIRESTYRNVPWVLHEKLAKKYVISTDPPEVLKGMVSLCNGLVVCSKKRKKGEDEQGDKVICVILFYLQNNFPYLYFCFCWYSK